MILNFSLHKKINRIFPDYVISLMFNVVAENQKNLHSIDNITLKPGRTSVPN